MASSKVGGGRKMPRLPRAGKPQKVTGVATGQPLPAEYSIIMRQNLEVSPAHPLGDITEVSDEAEDDGEDAGYSVIRQEDMGGYLSEEMSEEGCVSEEGEGVEGEGEEGDVSEEGEEGEGKGGREEEGGVVGKKVEEGVAKEDVSKANGGAREEEEVSEDSVFESEVENVDTYPSGGEEYNDEKELLHKTDYYMP